MKIYLSFIRYQVVMIDRKRAEEGVLSYRRWSEKTPQCGHGEG